MSGLLALLDDVTAIAKVAAASVDDIAAATAKAGAKAAGIVIDDAAVTPKYVTGLKAARELPMIWSIAKGSFFNKLVILLPALLLLESFLPVVIPYLLMLGGAYLCFEGAEKIAHLFHPSHEGPVKAEPEAQDNTALEKERVSGAIKTDFILSAEIMTIALSVVDTPSLWVKTASLAVVGILITIVVYGAVAMIVKMDDAGLHMIANGRTKIWRGMGRGLVLAMPKVMTFLSVVGTAAMLWVGGNIVVHGLYETQIWTSGYVWIKDFSGDVSASMGQLAGVVNWVIVAVFDGILGLILGLILIPIVSLVLAPLFAKAK